MAAVVAQEKAPPNRAGQLGSEALEVLSEGGVDRNFQAQVIHVITNVDRLISVGLRDLFEEAFPLVLVLGDQPEVAGGLLRLPEKLFGKGTVNSFAQISP